MEVWSVMVAEPVSPFEVRENLLRCFSNENRDRFAAQERALGRPSDGAAAVETMVRLAFKQVGGSFDRPSRETLTRVANLLSERSLEWGVSADDVFHCHANIMREIARVEDLPPRITDPGEPPRQGCAADNQSRRITDTVQPLRQTHGADDLPPGVTSREARLPN